LTGLYLCDRAYGRMSDCLTSVKRLFQAITMLSAFHVSMNTHTHTHVLSLLFSCPVVVVAVVAAVVVAAVVVVVVVAAAAAAAVVAAVVVIIIIIIIIIIIRFLLPAL